MTSTSTEAGWVLDVGLAGFGCLTTQELSLMCHATTKAWLQKYMVGNLPDITAQISVLVDVLKH